MFAEFTRKDGVKVLIKAEDVYAIEPFLETVSEEDAEPVVYASVGSRIFAGDHIFGVIEEPNIALARVEGSRT